MIIPALLSALLAGGGPRFEDVTVGSGVHFRHAHGGSGEKFLIETMGSGVALLDYDGDGDLDLFFVQSGPIPGSSGDARDRLFRNEGGWRFVEATAEAGLDDSDYGMGAVAADADGDGDEDLYVTNFGPDRFWRNRGDGTFEEAAGRARLSNPAWGTSAAFADLDLDGDLDLFVVNYLEYSLAGNPWCGRRAPGYRSYCHPDAFSGATDRLFRNEGDGTFTEVGASAGLRPGSRSEAKGLGIVCADLDLDGDEEIYVANDSTANYLYRNDGNLSFTEIGTEAGVAYNERGLTEAGMGTDAGDVDGDGRLDLFVTNLDDETNTLYRNLGSLFFEDATAPSGLAAPSLTKLGFGTCFLDSDGDGDADLFVANGHLLDNVALYKDNTTYAQRDQLFENLGRGSFRETRAGPYFEAARVSRAAACGDLDGDGDADLVVTASNESPVLLRNDGFDPARALLVVLFGRRSNRGGVGTVVFLSASGRTQMGEARRGSSYLSCGDPRLLFGLGDAAQAESLEVRWPSGLVQSFSGIPSGSRIEIREGDPEASVIPLRKGR